jgi:hypothetical protein
MRIITLLFLALAASAVFCEYVDHLQIENNCETFKIVLLCAGVKYFDTVDHVNSYCENLNITLLSPGVKYFYTVEPLVNHCENLYITLLSAGVKYLDTVQELINNCENFNIIWLCAGVKSVSIVDHLNIHSENFNIVLLCADSQCVDNVDILRKNCQNFNIVLLCADLKSVHTVDILKKYCENFNIVLLCADLTFVDIKMFMSKKNRDNLSTCWQFAQENPVVWEGFQKIPASVILPLIDSLTVTVRVQEVSLRPHKRTAKDLQDLREAKKCKKATEEKNVITLGSDDSSQDEQAVKKSGKRKPNVCAQKLGLSSFYNDLALGLEQYLNSEFDRSLDEVTKYLFTIALQ